MPVRVLDASGNGDAVTIARGVVYAVHHGAKVINLSPNFDPSVTTKQTPKLLRAFAYATRRGALVVAAAGNDSLGHVDFPARAASVLSLGATAGASSTRAPRRRQPCKQSGGIQAGWRAQDAVAERAVAIGYIPDGQAEAVARDSQLAPVPESALEDHVVVRELTQRVAEVSEHTRKRMHRLGQIDVASQDVLIDVVRALEQQQWMLRAQLAPARP